MNRSVRGLGEKGSSNIMESLTLRIEWSTRVHWFFTPWNHPDPLRPPSRKKRNERIYLAGDAAGAVFRSNCAKWAPRVFLLPVTAWQIKLKIEFWGRPWPCARPYLAWCGCPTNVPYAPHIHGSEQTGVSGRPFTIVSHHHAALLLSFRFATPFFRPLNNKIPRCSSLPPASLSPLLNLALLPVFLKIARDEYSFSLANFEIRHGGFKNNSLKMILITFLFFNFA